MKRVQNNVLDKFCELKGITRTYGKPYNPQHQGAVKVFNRTVKISLSQQKPQKR